MKKIYAMVIAVFAMMLVSCGSKTEKADNAEKEITAACACETCKCDPCECAEQGDSTAAEGTEKAEEDAMLKSVNGALNKSQTKAKAGRGACRHAGCGCQTYTMAHDGSGGKCVCGHWDYVHN